MATNTITWNNWIRGLNTLQSPLNIRKDELAVATNIVLTDEGLPSRRAGTATFGDALGSVTSPTLVPHYNKNGTNNLLAISNGYGVKRNDTTGAWTTVTSAASWPSSSRYNWTMLNNVTYIGSDQDPLTKFDGTYLTRFSTITTPTGLAGARGASLASGQYQLSYKITAENNVGETAASSAVTVAVDKKRDQWNFDPANPTSNYSVNLTWSAVSGATKYNIYGIESGFETYLDSVEGGGLAYRDYGIKVPSTLFTAPIGNSTDAPRGEIVKTFKSSLFVAGDPTEPSRLYFSAGVDKPDSFTISDGGGWIDVNKNGDDGVITGLGIFQDSLIVFKEYSIWKFDFSTSLLPSLVSVKQGLGCISAKTVLPVENDLFFMGKSIGTNPALYVLGNEPNYLNVLRTNEISARVRPELASLVSASYKRAAAIYTNNMVEIFYTDGAGTKNDLGLVYDRQRLAFTKWDHIYVENPLVWRNTSNAEKIIYADGNDKRVSEMSDNYGDDKGVAISWEIRTKQYQNRLASIFERTHWVNYVFKQIQGTIDFKFYHDDDTTTFSVAGQTRNRNTAFGYAQFGVDQFGTTNVDETGASSLLTKMRFPMHRLGNSSISNSFGIGLAGSTLTSKAILLNLEFERREMSKHFRPLTEIYQI